MTIEENLNDIEKGFKEFSEKMDVFLDSFAESLYDLKKQIKTENKVPEPSGLWKPKEGDKIFFITEYGEIESIKYTSNSPSYNFGNTCIAIGNCFRTQEEAEKALERLKIRRQLKDIALRLNKGREINWSDADDKYCLSIYLNEEITTIAQKYLKMQNTIYCLDENFKDAAIAEIGEERLKRYLRSV